jgi:hypothetical protein
LYFPFGEKERDWLEFSLVEERAKRKKKRVMD